ERELRRSARRARVPGRAGLGRRGHRRAPRHGPGGRIPRGECTAHRRRRRHARLTGAGTRGAARRHRPAPARARPVTLLFGLLAPAAARAAPRRWRPVSRRDPSRPGSTARFSARWIASPPRTPALYVLLAAPALLGLFLPPIWVATAAVLLVWPLGLG